VDGITGLAFALLSLFASKVLRVTKKSGQDLLDKTGLKAQKKQHRSAAQYNLFFSRNT